ncbi:MAG TPA: peptidase M28, partial [Sphingobacteriaceae bacterium]
MKKNLLLTYLLAGGVLTAFAQAPNDPATIEKIRTEGLKNSKVMETAFYITDVAGPRLSNSPGLQRAQEWAVNTLKTWGLQNVKLEPWGTFGKGWEVKKYYAAMTAPYYAPLIGSPKAWTPGTNGPVKAEIVVVKADTITDLDKYKGQLKGKIVMLENGTPIETTFKADGTRYTEEELEALASPPQVREGGNRGGNNDALRARFMRMRELRNKMSEFFMQENVGLILTRTRGTHGTFFTSNGASYAADAKPVSPEVEMST